MDLDAIQTVLTTWFATISGLDVEWWEEPYHIYNTPFALLNIGPISNVGVDGTMYEYTLGTDTLTPKQFGLRRFTVHCRVRAFDQRQGFSARQSLETARLRAWRPENIQTLNDANISLVRADPLILQDYDHDDRRISQIMMDMIFEQHVCEADGDTGGDGSYIGRTTGTGTLEEGVNGDISVPLDIDTT